MRRAGRDRRRTSFSFLLFSTSFVSFSRSLFAVGMKENGEHYQDGYAGYGLFVKAIPLPLLQQRTCCHGSAGRM